MTQPLVAIRSVSKNFGEFQALNRVSLDVRAGEVLCLIGASGSGKTTLLRCINQLTPIDSGGIWLDGELLGVREEDGRLHRLSERQIARQRLKTGMVFQRFNLFPHLTALENITEGPVHVLKQRAVEARATAHALLERVGLRDKAGAYPAELSGGQQQRVAAARALASRPQVVFADEPTGALDSRSGAELLGFLRTAVSELGQTVVMVTHDATAASYADRVIFLADGHIVDEMYAATADEILDYMKRLGA